MKSIKHLTRSHLQEKMSFLLYKCGLEGYGFYWLLCEIVAEQSGFRSVKAWRKQLRVSRKKLLHYLHTLAAQELIFIEQSGEEISIDVPNLVIVDRGNRCD